MNIIKNLKPKKGSYCNKGLHTLMLEKIFNTTITTIYIITYQSNYKKVYIYLSSITCVINFSP